ncbi:MAG: hypothetical protein OXF99_06620 [bacterium]|nr:hypothetical protein [bacterium]
MRFFIKFYQFGSAALTEIQQRFHWVWRSERGDVTSTVIIIAVLVAAAVAAGVVITTFISEQTSKIS